MFRLTSHTWSHIWPSIHDLKFDLAYMISHLTSHMCSDIKPQIPDFDLPYIFSHLNHHLIHLTSLGCSDIWHLICVVTYDLSHMHAWYCPLCRWIEPSLNRWCSVAVCRGMFIVRTLTLTCFRQLVIHIPKNMKLSLGSLWILLQISFKNQFCKWCFVNVQIYLTIHFLSILFLQYLYENWEMIKTEFGIFIYFFNLLQSCLLILLTDYSHVYRVLSLTAVVFTVYC